MSTKRFKPLVDKLFFMIAIPTVALLFAVTVICAISDVFALIFITFIDIFVIYFIISPLFGYVELRKNSILIKYGFILKKEIPYEKIRAIQKERKFYSESMMSLKNSYEHVNIKYNTFDVTTVSVLNNDDFIYELEERLRMGSPDLEQKSSADEQ